MSSETPSSPSAGSPLLQSFRFDGLRVGRPGGPSGKGEGDCDVFLALDFSGSSTEPLPSLLADARRRLGQQGVLLLGLPNRFALRFWSGCPEPSRGLLFTTLEDSAGAQPSPRWGERAPHYVSGGELVQALTSAGFRVVERFFATPDRPEAPHSGTIYSERLAAAAPELAAALESPRPAADPHRPRLDLFAEELVSRELARAGLLGDLAAYFLFAAIPVAEAPGASDPGAGIWQRLRPPTAEIGWHLAAGRKDPVETVFRLDGTGIEIDKRRLVAGPPPDFGRYAWVSPPRTRLTSHELLRFRLQAHLVAGRSEEFFADLSGFFERIRQIYRRDEALEGEALDAVVSNALLDRSGNYHLFDLEWRSRESLAPTWWILRNVLACTEMRGRRISGIASAADLYSSLCRRQGLEPDLSADLARETEFATAVRAADPAGLGPALAASLARRWPVPVAQGLDSASLAADLALADAHHHLVAEYRRLEAWMTETRHRAEAAESEYRSLLEIVRELQSANRALEEEKKRLEAGARGTGVAR